jgi:hypothetical protein
MPRLGRILALLAAFLACAALVVAPGLAAGGKKYKGKTAHNRPIGFKVKGRKVVKFVAGINLFCTGKGIEFNAVIPPHAMKLRKGGRFRYKGKDKEKSATIEIHGRVKGEKAKGTVYMFHSWYDNGTFQPCEGKAKWHAKRR